jgi:hypothetical protein
MSFDTHKGTRGGRQPSGFGLHFVNNLMVGRLRRKGGKIMGFNGLVLTTVGRKTGAERTNPVGWFPGKDGSWLIVASANGRSGTRRGTTTSPHIPTRSGSRSTARR